MRNAIKKKKINNTLKQQKDRQVNKKPYFFNKKTQNIEAINDLNNYSKAVMRKYNP